MTSQFNTDKSELEEYKTDHLFLLIGSNPLPNYVSAHLLIKPQGTIYLVHSSSGSSATGGTYRIAERLRGVLEEKKNRNEIDFRMVQLVGVSESDSSNIKTEIGRCINQIPKNKSIGLNYTGGTKAMAVHTYLRLFREKQRPLSTIFSYLDARSLSLQVEQSITGSTSEIPTQMLVTPSIDELVSLHGEVLKENSPVKTPILHNAANALWELYRLGDTGSWFNWRKRNIESLRRDRSYYCRRQNKYINWRDERVLQCQTLPIPPADIGIEIDKVLQCGPQFNLGDAQDTLKIPECNELCDWFAGTWLEHHVLGCLQEIRQSNRISLGDIGLSLDTDENAAVQGSDHHDFEVDVAALHGYKFFAFSCTTSGGKGAKAKIKQKLFEAIIRARQLGGDEAQVGLVLTYFDRNRDIAAILEQEVRASWRVANTIKVFTPQNDPNLEESLIQWIEKGV